MVANFPLLLLESPSNGCETEKAKSISSFIVPMISLRLPGLFSSPLGLTFLLVDKKKDPVKDRIILFFQIQISISLFI